MEFCIDVHTQNNGEVTIEDLSKEYNLYTNEELPIEYDKYKYSLSVTINVVNKVNVTDTLLEKTLFSSHTEEIDSCTFLVADDGYYKVDHLILPNKLWYLNVSAELKQLYDTIYIVDNDIIYKELDGKLEECPIQEVIERNPEGTTIKKCKVDIFFTGNLLKCYIYYCKKLFNNLLNKCVENSDNLDIFARDFIWMTINIIDYLIEFKLFMEAERLIEMFKLCGGFCHELSKNNIGCGCS